jgi:hypothetical protein
MYSEKISKVAQGITRFDRTQIHFFHIFLKNKIDYYRRLRKKKKENVISEKRKARLGQGGGRPSKVHASRGDSKFVIHN